MALKKQGNMKNWFSTISLLATLMFGGVSYQGCSEKQPTLKYWILLVDYTVYDETDMVNELEKFQTGLKESLMDYNKFQKLRKGKILYMIVDDRGGNTIFECDTIPDFQGFGKKNIHRMAGDDKADGKEKGTLRKCFDKIKNDPQRKPHTEYKKTLYLQAINRALEEIGKDSPNNNYSYKISIFGDLAIVDSECFLEKNPCECKSFKGLNDLKNKITRYRKNYPHLNIKWHQINIPGEEACRRERQKIWNRLIPQSPV